MKKWSFIMLACVLLLTTFLTACGKDNNAGDVKENKKAEVSNQAEKANTESPKPVEPVLIKFYSHEKNDANEPFQKAIKEFNEIQSEIIVENVSLVQNADMNQYIEKLDVLMAAGEQVDGVFFTQDHLQSHAALGVLEPLGDYFSKESINTADEYFVNPTHDGQQYGMMITASPWLVMFNEEHLKEANLPLPDFGWTWDDFRAYAKALTKGEGNEKRYGTFFPTWGEFANPITYTDNPQPFLTEDGQLRYNEDSFKYWFEMRRAMEEDDKSVQKHADILATNPNIWADYFTGKASMYLTGSFGLKFTIHNETFPHTFKTVYAPVPRMPGQTEEGLTIMSGDYLAIGNKSKHKGETFKFLRWLSTEGAVHIPKQSAWKNGDGVANVKKLVGDNTDVVDIDSFVHVLFDKRVKTAGSSKVSVPYAGQLKKVLEEGFTKFQLDKTTAEEAQQFMMDEGKKIMDQQK